MHFCYSVLLTLSSWKTILSQVYLQFSLNLISPHTLHLMFPSIILASLGFRGLQRPSHCWTDCWLNHKIEICEKWNTYISVKIWEGWVASSGRIKDVGISESHQTGIALSKLLCLRGWQNRRQNKKAQNPFDKWVPITITGWLWT